MIDKYLYLKLLVVFSFAVLTVFGLPKKPESRIYDGKETPIEAAPFVASVRVNGAHKCGGAIIGDDLILTAGICVDGVSASKLSVRVGSRNHKEGGLVVNAKKFILHPDYDEDEAAFNIAIIKLEKVIVDAYPNVKPIGFDTRIPLIVVNIFGWGARFPSWAITDFLRSGEITYEKWRFCLYKETSKSRGYFRPGMFCSEYSENTMCGSGDIGDPVVSPQTNLLIGLAVDQEDCKNPLVYFADVIQSRDWIINAMKNI